MRAGLSIDIKSGGVWFPAFVAAMYDVVVDDDQHTATYLTLYYTSTEWYGAYTEHAEYRSSTNRIVFANDSGGDTHHAWRQSDTRASFADQELDSILSQELCDYDETVKERVWFAWTSMSTHQRQAMVGGIAALIDQCGGGSYTD
jgi:hypothetical protein